MAAKVRKLKSVAEATPPLGWTAQEVAAGFGQAKAALWLLDERAAGGLSVSVGADEAENSDVEEWLDVLARGALRDGLKHAETAFSKLVPNGGA